MCTLMAAGLVMGGVSALAGASSALQQGKQQAAQANYQAQVAANNAVTADVNAKQMEATGRAEEQRARIIAAQKTGAMRAQAGSSGFDVGSGSFVDEFATSDVMGDYDARAVRNQYQTQANAYHTQAGNFGSEVGMYNTAAKNAIKNSQMSALGSLIGGAAQMGMMMGFGGGGGASASPDAGALAAKVQKTANVVGAPASTSFSGASLGKWW